MPVISAHEEVARLVGGSVAPIDVLPMLRPVRGAIFTSVDNGLG